jgi:hypothetical protein
MYSRMRGQRSGNRCSLTTFDTSPCQSSEAVVERRRERGKGEGRKEIKGEERKTNKN